MAWVNVFPPAQWTITDQDVTEECSYHLLENAGVTASNAFSTAQFSTAQLIAALNDRQRRFIRDTGITTVLTEQDVTPQVPRYDLPQDLIDIRRMAWRPDPRTVFTAPSPVTPLIRADAWELDHGMLDWQFNFDDPSIYHTATLPTLKVEIAKAPNRAGLLELLYIQLGVTLDGSGIALSIPPEFVPFVKWGALADLLKSDAEGQDMERAAFCEQLYGLGVQLAKMLLMGSVVSGR